jgi:hypothetical protein
MQIRDRDFSVMQVQHDELVHVQTLQALERRWEQEREKDAMVRAFGTAPPAAQQHSEGQMWREGKRWLEERNVGRKGPAEGPTEGR